MRYLVKYYTDGKFSGSVYLTTTEFRARIKTLADENYKIVAIGLDIEALELFRLVKDDKTAIFFTLTE